MFPIAGGTTQACETSLVAPTGQEALNRFGDHPSKGATPVLVALLVLAAVLIEVVPIGGDLFLDGVLIYSGEVATK